MKEIVKSLEVSFSIGKWNNLIADIIDEKGRIRRRKVAGLVFGTVGSVTLILNIAVIVMLSLLIDYLWSEIITYDEYVGDPVVPVLGSIMFILTILALVLFSLMGIFSIVKIISGILIYKGKGQATLTVLLVLSINFSIFMAFIIVLSALVTHSVEQLIFLVLVAADIGLWSYFLWAMSTSWKTFRLKKEVTAIRA